MTADRYRSAVTGEYVTEEFAARHPETTVREADMPLMTEATARELLAAIRENTAAVTRAAVANEGVMQVLRESESEPEPEQPEGPQYL